MNGFSNHSRPIVVSSVWPGKTRVSGGSSISFITDSRTWSGSPPPTASLKRMSPEKQTCPLKRKATWSSEGGCRIASICIPASSKWLGHDFEPQLGLVLDVVGVGVRAQDVGGPHLPARGDRLERLHGSAAVDEHGPLAVLIRDQVGVREPVRMHAPLDAHRRIGYAPQRTEEEGVVAGLFERMSLVIKSKLNRLLDRAEDPSETLDYSYEEQLKLLQNVKRGVADVTTSKKRLELQSDKLEQSVVRLDAQARDALGAGREDLARQALERKTLAQQQLQDLDQQVQATGGAAGQAHVLRAAALGQDRGVPVAEGGQQGPVLGRRGAGRIGEAATGIGEQMADTGLAIQRAKDKTEQMQARAGAVEELIEAGTLEDFTAGDQTQLDRELAQISAEKQVDAELRTAQGRDRRRARSRRSSSR